MSNTIDNNSNNLHILNSIIDGYSKYDISIGTVYLKHPSQKDTNSIYIAYNKFCKNYESQGILAEKDQISFICEMGWWSEDKENQLFYFNKSLERLKNTRSKLVYQNDKDRINEQILDIEKKILLITKERSEYIQSTSENMASKDSAYFFIENFIFSDKKMKNKVINENNEYEDDFYAQLMLIYYLYLGTFNNNNIKRVALSVPFQNMLHATPSCSSMDFFGLPVVKLTKNQMDILTWGSYYQKLIKNCQKDIPEELYDSPDKFLEWYESVHKVQVNKKSSKKQSSKKSKYGSDSKFLFGERDEVKRIGGGDISGDKILKDAHSSGGQLNFYDLMEK